MVEIEKEINFNNQQLRRDNLDGRLLDAACKNDCESVLNLLQAGASPIWFDESSGNRAHHYAVLHRDSIMLNALLDAHADPSLKNWKGQTLLDLAIELRHWDMVQLIAKKQRIQSGTQPDLGRKLLHAARNNNRESVLTLLQAGASANWCDNQGYTALHYAISHRDPDMVIALLDAHADLTQKNYKDKTPLDLAIELRHWDMVKLIAEKFRNNLSQPEKLCSILLTATKHNISDSFVDNLLQGSSIYDDLQLRMEASKTLKIVINIANDVNNFKNRYKCTNDKRLESIKNLEFQIGKSYIEIYQGKNPAEVMKDLFRPIKAAQQFAERDHEQHGALRFKHLSFFKPTKSRLAEALKNILKKYELDKEHNNLNEQQAILSKAS